MKESGRALRFLLFSMSAGLIEMGSFALLNSELRIRLLSFNFIGQSWYVAVNPLFDAGRVTGLYKADELSSFYGRSVEALSKDAARLHLSAGGGLKLAMNRNFIVSAEGDPGSSPG